MYKLYTWRSDDDKNIYVGTISNAVTQNQMTSSTCIRESKPHGRVYVVGNVNHYDELGKEDNHEITHPIPLEHLRDELITEVAAGKYHSLAINKEGKVSLPSTLLRITLCVIYKTTS